MLSLLLISATFTAYVDSLSCAPPPYPQFGTFYIQLLSATEYPDSILLTIWRPPPLLPDPSSFGPGPWCTIMNVTDGSVTPLVNCGNFNKLTRPYSSPDTDPASTTVSCADNCDGATATCTFTRYGIDTTITNIPYTDSNPSGCGAATTSPPFMPIGGNGLFTSHIPPLFTPGTSAIYRAFAIDSCNVYIVFNSNTVGINFCVRNMDGYIIRNVSPAGDGWWALKPYINYPSMGLYDTRFLNPFIYSSVNVISTHSRLCYSNVKPIYRYTIESDPTGAYDEIFTINYLTDVEEIDSVKARAFIAGDGTVRVYDLSTGSWQLFEVDICRIIKGCLVSPCSTSTCSYNPSARCVDDYCGGCIARWYCGSVEITNNCAQQPISTSLCI